MFRCCRRRHEPFNMYSRFLSRRSTSGGYWKPDKARYSLASSSSSVPATALSPGLHRAQLVASSNVASCVSFCPQCAIAAAALLGPGNAPLPYTLRPQRYARHRMPLQPRSRPELWEFRVWIFPFRFTTTRSHPCDIPHVGVWVTLDGPRRSTRIERSDTRAVWWKVSFSSSSVA